MTPTQADINKLLQSYPLPSEQKMLKRMASIERMIRFYRDKAEIAPQKQALMFRSYISALNYSLSSIRAYRSLTNELGRLAEHQQ